MNLLRRLFSKRTGQLFASSLMRESGRTNSRRVQDTLEKLGLTFHEPLISDQAKIASIIKEKQARFEQYPYNSACLGDYLTVLTIFGYEKEAQEVIRSLRPQQYLRLQLNWSMYHPNNKHSLIESYFESTQSVIGSMVRKISTMLMVMLAMLLYSARRQDNMDDAMNSIVSNMLLIEEPKKVEKPNVRFSDIIVAWRDQGIDEYRAEVEELVDFLKDPEKYITAGAKMPKGILFHGSRG